MSKLVEESQEEIRKEPPTTNIQVFYQDLNTGIEYVSVECVCVVITRPMGNGAGRYSRCSDCRMCVMGVFFQIYLYIFFMFQCKTFAIGPDESAKDCIKIALDHLEMRDTDPGQFQLLAKTPREEPPYPLFGHEKPYSIKLSCLRDGLSAEEGFDLDHCNNIHDPLARCHFILR